MVCEFDAAKEAGERLASTPSEDDFRHTAAHAARSTKDRFGAVAPAPADRVQEVNRLAFSADGTYLAVARNDTRSTCMTRGCSTGAVRSTCSRTMVTRWRRMRMASSRCSGVDGSIRLWDVKKAYDDLSNGVVLAQGDYDVGHFSLGDTHEGEMALVVGELSGNVTVFDRTGRLDI
ncbi:hypothetical protein A0H81_00676 [Grifola frondosa]|uniref:Uncharacterized protein n=1 Tax=Grifola frondosa TaxID=5627 RepID=A0A1C7MSY2_GRIFR|nr:hypothetical protein A0H81_00676 [Grifola frondosa]